MSGERAEGARPAGNGYWFTPLPLYLLEAVYNPNSPVNAPAAMLWAHIHRHYAWRQRVFPSYATLADETSQSESAVKRQLKALREVGALDWGAGYGRSGRTSNEYALAPYQPFQFDRDVTKSVQVKNDPYPGVQVKNDQGVQVKSEPHRQVKNDLGVKNTGKERSLSHPTDHSGPARAPSAEREKPTVPSQDRDGSVTKATGPAAAVAAAWSQARGGHRVRSTEQAITAQAVQLLADGWTVGHLTAVAAWMAGRHYTDLERAVTHPQAPADPSAAQPAQGASALPEWCGQCDGPEVARRWIDTEAGMMRCQECNPHSPRFAAKAAV
jgi:hypothetical protein